MPKLRLRRKRKCWHAYTASIVMAMLCGSRSWELPFLLSRLNQLKCCIFFVLHSCESLSRISSFKRSWKFVIEVSTCLYDLWITWKPEIKIEDPAKQNFHYTNNFLGITYQNPDGKYDIKTRRWMACSGSDLRVISYSGLDDEDFGAEYSWDVRTGLEMSFGFSSILPGTLRLRVEAFSVDGPSWCQCYKTFFLHCRRRGQISLSVCTWQSLSSLV
jgi:hypothetical protein